MTTPGSGRTAVILVDLQRQFTEPDGMFAVHGMDTVLARTVPFVTAARAAGAAIVWIRQKARPEVGLGRASLRYGRPDAHVGPGTDLDPRLVPAPGDIVVDKYRQSAFFMTDLDLILRRLDVRRVLIAGITTNVCVLATTKDASERDYETIVLRDLTAALPIPDTTVDGLSAAEVQRASLAFIQWAYGDVLTSDQIGWDS